jgi:hypothetical protein
LGNLSATSSKKCQIYITSKRYALQYRIFYSFNLTWTINIFIIIIIIFIKCNWVITGVEWLFYIHKYEKKKKVTRILSREGYMRGM